MIEFPDTPYDGQQLIDEVDESNVVIWTYDASDNSWRANEYGPGSGFTTRTDMVYLADQYGNNPHPTAPELKGIHIPDDLYLAKQKDLNEFFVYCLQEIDAILGGLEVTGGVLYEDNIRLRGQEGTQADLNLKNKEVTAAAIVGLRGDQQFVENVLGVKMRGVWEHQGGAGSTVKGVEPGFFKMYEDQGFSNPVRTQDYQDVQQIWVSVDSLGVGDYVRNSQEFQKGDVVTINETRTQSGGAYRITHVRVDWESEDQGEFYVMNLDPIEGAQYGSIDSGGQVTIRVTPCATSYLPLSGGKVNGNVFLEEALTVGKAMVVTLSGGGMFVVEGEDNNGGSTTLLKSRGQYGTAIQYKGLIEEDDDLVNKQYIDQQIDALRAELKNRFDP